jgi:hypothetical protein
MWRIGTWNWRSSEKAGDEFGSQKARNLTGDLQLCGIARRDRGRPARIRNIAGGTPAVPARGVSESSEPATHAEVEDRITVFGVTAGHADALE